MTYHMGSYNVPTVEEVDAALEALFAEKAVITVVDLCNRLHLSRSYAYNLANKLEKSGKLKDVGSRYRKLYVKGDG